MLYAEITKEFFELVIKADTKNTYVLEGEHSRKTFYDVCGVRVLAIWSHISNAETFFIQDINA